MPFERLRLSGGNTDDAHHSHQNLKEDYLWI